MIADISVSFATGRPFQASVLADVVSALAPLGFALTGDYTCHHPPAEPFTGDRFQDGDLDTVFVDEPRALKNPTELEAVAEQFPVTGVGLRWSTSVGELDGYLMVRVFDDDTVAIDLTIPEATDRGRVPMNSWRAVADVLYHATQPFYGAVLVEDEVLGPSDIGGESDLVLRASWIYLGPRLARSARSGLEGLRPLNEEQVLKDGGLFLSSNDEPALTHSRKEQKLYGLVNASIADLELQQGGR